MAFNGGGPITQPPDSAAPPTSLCRGLGSLPRLVTVNGVLWLLLLPAIAAIIGDGIETATAEQKLTFFIGTVVVIGGACLVNALFSLAMGRALALVEGPKAARAFMSGGLLQFTSAATGMLAFGRWETWSDETTQLTVGGLATAWLAYSYGHFQQARAARHIAPKAWLWHAVTPAVGLFWVPVVGFELDLDEYGVAGIALAIAQVVCGLAFPIVIGVVWLRYGAGLRRIVSSGGGRVPTGQVVHAGPITAGPPLPGQAPFASPLLGQEPAGQTWPPQEPQGHAPQG
ncbi:hypothetical protein ACFWWC_49020 [Streptomyces sp. NPDC058642]|uniref:hypothetical protein n=1 Tax=Streptomyces sp. NPDC058642 TaxID=3346572 RepID=UPI0036653AD3